EEDIQKDVQDEEKGERHQPPLLLRHDALEGRRHRAVTSAEYSTSITASRSPSSLMCSSRDSVFMNAPVFSRFWMKLSISGTPRAMTLIVRGCRGPDCAAGRTEVIRTSAGSADSKCWRSVVHENVRLEMS